MFNFTSREDIERLVDAYLQHDFRWQMRQRNGMTRKMCINDFILNQFLDDNDSLFWELERDPTGMPTREALLPVARICSEHYLVKPEVLIEAYMKVNGTDFLDPEERERIEKGFREILGEREQ